MRQFLSILYLKQKKRLKRVSLKLVGNTEIFSKRPNFFACLCPNHQSGKNKVEEEAEQSAVNYQRN